MFKGIPIVGILLVCVLVVENTHVESDASIVGHREKRMAEKHHLAMHTHMSRKVLDRACAASKDVIDEIIACVTNNKTLMESKQWQKAAECHKEAFGVDFDPKDLTKHHAEICQQKDKFETMVGCVYEKISNESTSAEMQQLTESMVDVGLCIVNALDS